MAIAIVDDTIFSLKVIKAFLMSAGYVDIITLQSAKELYRLIDFSGRPGSLPFKIRRS